VATDQVQQCALMKGCHALCWWLSIAALGVAAIGASPRTQTVKPFEPRSGQPGKDVPWVPTPAALIEKMLDLAGVTSEDYLIDLGSGDGRTVIAAARRGAAAMGIEYNADLVALSQRNATAQNVGGKATFVQADLFASDLSKATVITMFLLPSINVQLRARILDLRPGTRIVSTWYDMGEWPPDGTAAIPGCTQWCRALLWIVPARIGGIWRLVPPADLSLTQTYQMVSGTFASGGAGSSTPVVNGRLRGAEIAFEAGGARYTGRVTGETMQGTFLSEGKEGTWQASRTRR
jgi:SAM-dependent methyltransferase